MWLFILNTSSSSPADPPPFIDGIRINSPHYLTKMKLTSAGTHTFTLVVSQYEKQNTINYTLRVRDVNSVYAHTQKYNLKSNFKSLVLILFFSTEIISNSN